MDNNNFEEDRTNFMNQAESFLQQNLLSQTLAIAEQRLKQFPADVDAHVIAGDVLARMGRIDEALDILRKVEKIISDLSVVYVRIGDIYQKNGFNRDASICYQKYNALNPTVDQTKEITEKLILPEQEESPRAEIEETGDINLPRPDFYTVTLADLYIKQGHLKMAAEVLQEIIRKEPANIQAGAKLDTVKAAISLKSAAGDKVTGSGDLINILSRWLENVGRIKNNAT
jgi:tetratricopeptide (TPR) repeat protein